MSSIALTPNASGTGAFTIASPNSNTNQTLTLPDATGTLLAGSGPVTVNASAANGSLTIDSSGNVGIGTSTTTYKLEVQGNTNGYIGQRIYNLNSGSSAVSFLQIGNDTNGATAQIGLNSSANTTNIGGANALYLSNGLSAPIALATAGSERMRIASDGVVTIANLAGSGSRAVNASATGVLSAASDSRLKQEVPEAPIAGLAEIMQLRPVAYKWLDDIANRGDDAAVELGFFADEAKNVIPSSAPMGNDGYYGFYDRAVIAALTKAIQEQQAIITALEARIAALEAK